MKFSMEKHSNQSNGFIVPPVCLFEKAFGQSEPLILVGEIGKIDLKSGILGSSISEANMLVESSFLSRKHCVLSHKGKTWWIEDLNTTNGTWVNDRRLNPGEPTVIREDDRLQLADLKFIVKRKK